LVTAHLPVAPPFLHEPQNSAFERENLKNSTAYAEQFS
jgi:hypothetical protein